MADQRRGRAKDAARRVPLLRPLYRLVTTRNSALAARMTELHVENRNLRRQIRELQKETRQEFRRLRSILQFVYDDLPGNRRRLWELRSSPEYETAFTEREPLVSVIVPTYTNVEGLVRVAVPSVLAQRYTNWELMVVGDCAPPETAEALAEFGDPRIRYYNRERRGPYPDDHLEMRLVMGGPPYNEAVRRARGRWIAPFADDDAYTEDALATLVSAAQEHRHELCYSQFNRYEPDGTHSVRGEWPPELMRFSLLGSIYHAGLATFIEYELADLPFRVSGDMSIVRRMLQAGVRFGQVQRPLVDYHWKPRRPHELDQLESEPPID